MPTDKPQPVRVDWPGLRRPFDWLRWPNWPSLFEPWPILSEETMRLEEYEEGNELVVRAEMPGLDPEKDIEIQVIDDTLRIHAQRRQESKTEEKGRYHSEFRYGAFSRTLALPAGASEQDVKAAYTDGILEVRVPIDRSAAEARKVPIQRG